MKILKIIHGYPPIYNAGSEVYTQSISNESSKGHYYIIFTREENPYAPDFTLRKKIEHPSLVFYYINMAQGKDGFRHAELDEKFLEVLRQERPDIAHIGHLNHLSTGIVDVLHSLKIPIVFTLHDFWLMCPRGQFLRRNTDGKEVFQLCEKQDHSTCASVCYKPYFSGYDNSLALLSQGFTHKPLSGADALNDELHWTRWIEARMIETRSIIDKVNLFIAPSRYLRDRFIKDFDVPPSKIKYLDYGFPTDYLKPVEKKDNKGIYSFGYIGTHIPAKGLNQLIEAFKNVNAPAELLIFGRCDGQNTLSLKELAKSSKNKIEFFGEYQNQNIAREVFAKVDCIVVPSIWGENSPLVIHEAQACRVPVITADFGGMKEYVQHMVNGLLFKHRDIDSLMEQMNFAVHNPDLMKVLGSKGYLYSLDGNVPDIKEHCEELDKLYRLATGKRLWRLTLDTNPEDCNLHCIMCEEHSPYSNFKEELYRQTGVKRRRMSMETVREIFSQAKDIGVREIIPSTMGEPLLFDGIKEIYDLSEKYEIKINLTTNGTFPKLDMEEWGAMIIPNTTDVKISWNGATSKTSEMIMTGLDFNKSIKNLKTFVQLRNDHYSEAGHYCRITLQLTFMTSNIQELSDIIRFAAENDVDRIKGHHAWIHFPEMEEMSLLSDPGNILYWNKIVNNAEVALDQYRRPNGDKVILENILPIDASKGELVPEDYECPFLGKELWISASGKISPCCAPDIRRDTLGDFGNIKETKLSDAFNSDVYNDLMINYKNNDLCKTCKMRRPTLC